MSTLYQEGILYKTINGIGRTNNKVEGWHNTFARLVGQNHPDIVKFIASLQRELSLGDRN
ncbi:hypothetical protein HZS_1859 [Henneguya salminicola]|nr:hypothetical protein HZS_1859 [Henneguya salminicola]